MELNVVQFIINGPYFWGSLGFTTASGMLIGAGLWNGDKVKVRKAVFSLGIFGLFYFFVNGLRVNGAVPVVEILQPGIPAMAWASTLTFLFVLLAYILGLWFGVLLLHRRHHE